MAMPSQYKSKISSCCKKEEEEKRRRRRMRSSKILSRDRESCRQLQSPAQFPRINNVFNQNPNNLHNGNRSEEFKYINEYPPDQKSNPPRRNTFGKWHSFKKMEEIRDERKNIVGYKQEYDFVDNQEKKNGLKMREYTRHKRGENDYSYCVIYKKKKYVYSIGEELGRDMERQPDEKHRSSLAPISLQVQSPTIAQRQESTTPSASQNTNLSSATLNPSDENISMEEILFSEDPGLQIDLDFMLENDDFNPWLSTHEDHIDDMLKINFPKGHDLQKDPNSMFIVEME